MEKRSADVAQYEARDVAAVASRGLCIRKPAKPRLDPAPKHSGTYRRTSQSHVIRYLRLWHSF
jgi:hypothetical protein